tara:strand:- start:2863 stop:3369 length:507 start_codon:yes stop_codon:yes gene_type:complete
MNTIKSPAIHNLLTSYLNNNISVADYHNDEFMIGINKGIDTINSYLKDNPLFSIKNITQLLAESNDLSYLDTFKQHRDKLKSLNTPENSPVTVYVVEIGEVNPREYLFLSYEKAKNFVTEQTKDFNLSYLKRPHRFKVSLSSTTLNEKELIDYFSVDEINEYNLSKEK